MCGAQLSQQWSELPASYTLEGHALYPSESLNKCLETHDESSWNSQWAYPGALHLYRCSVQVMCTDILNTLPYQMCLA